MSGTHRSGFAGVSVARAKRPSRCCPIGRRRQGSIASIAGNKLGSCCADPTVAGNDLFRTSPMHRGRQIHRPCDAGPDACCTGNLLAAKLWQAAGWSACDWPHHPCLGLDRDPPYSAHRGKKSVNRQVLDELKQQISLLDYLQAQDWRPARRLSRGRLMGLCPLHDDHQPSFLVDPSKSLFYCYGCGRGGDVIRFAELYHQVKFPQALALLHQWRGLPPLLHEAAEFLSHAVTPPWRGGCLPVPTRHPLAGTHRAHANRLCSWRLPARLADAVGLLRSRFCAKPVW